MWAGSRPTRLAGKARRPRELGTERAGQTGDRVARGRRADLLGEPGTGEAGRDDVRPGGDRGQAVLDVAARGPVADRESQSGYLGVVHDVDVHVQVYRQVAEFGQRGYEGGGGGGDAADLAGGEGNTFGAVAIARGGQHDVAFRYRPQTERGREQFGRTAGQHGHRHARQIAGGRDGWGVEV